MPLPSAPLAADADQRKASACPESSPLWSIVLTLADVATRIERRRSEEHEAKDAGEPDEEAAA